MEDNGAAFIDTLEKRQTPFGSLTLRQDGLCLTDHYQKRLVQVGVLDHLRIPLFHDYDDLARLTFSAKVESLEFFVYLSALDIDFQSLNIVAKKLSLALDRRDRRTTNVPTESVVSLFQRLADLGHFEELKVRFNFFTSDMKIPECVVQELIRLNRNRIMRTTNRTSRMD